MSAFEPSPAAEPESRGIVIVTEVEGDDEVANCTEVAQVLKIWEDRVNANTLNNPVPILNKLSQFLEKEMQDYLKLDPDPFDDRRHPSRTHPNCSFGHTLKLLFKKDIFMTKLVHDYLRENWGELDLSVNTAACRLFINVLPGLETTVVYQVS